MGLGLRDCRAERYATTVPGVVFATSNDRQAPIHRPRSQSRRADWPYTRCGDECAALAPGEKDYAEAFYGPSTAFQDAVKDGFWRTRTAISVTEEKRELTGRSNELLDALHHLKAAESQKRQEPISTPAFHELQDEVDVTSREIFRMAREQGRLADEIPTGSDTIDDVDDRTDTA